MTEPPFVPAGRLPNGGTAIAVFQTLADFVPLHAADFTPVQRFQQIGVFTVANCDQDGFLLPFPFRLQPFVSFLSLRMAKRQRRGAICFFIVVSHRPAGRMASGIENVQILQQATSAPQLAQHVLILFQHFDIIQIKRLHIHF